MVHFYSSDLRSRVLSYAASETPYETSLVFSVGESTVIRWLRLYKTTGQTAAKPFGSKRVSKLEAYKSWLLMRVSEDTAVTLLELQTELFQSRGLKISQSALWQFLKRQGLSFKKNSLRHRTAARRCE